MKKGIQFFAFILVLLLGYSCCSTKHKPVENQVTTSPPQDSTVTPVDSASYQRGLQHSVEEKLLKTHKEKLKTK